MKLHQLRNLITVADKGSLRAASRQLGLAQPAITRSIAQLEHELGAPLFERRRSGVVLTPLGSMFVRRARIAVGELSRAREEFEQHQGGVQGSVVACLSTSAHMALLPAALGPFRARYPGVSLHIIEGFKFSTVEARLRDGTIDFYAGMAPDERPGSELAVEHLFDNTRAVLARAGHPLARVRSLAALADAEWVSIGPKSERDLTDLFARHGLAPPRFSATGDSALSLMTLVAHTDLLAMLPRQWTSFAPVASSFAHIRIREVIPAPAIVIVRRTEMPLTPAAEHLCDLLRRAAGPSAGAAGAAA
jgi:LysR family transcriptional regulator, regulator of abg operon